EARGGGPGVVLKTVGGAQDLIASITDRLAGVARLERRQPVDVGADQLRDLVEDLGSGARGRVAPGATLERGPCRLDGGVDVGWRGNGRGRHHFRGGGLDDLERL